MPQPGNRRPLASRQTGWAQRLAGWLAGTGITPNGISILGIGAALLAGLCFWAAGAGWPRGLFLILAAAFVQLRLLCNLLDGMVAVEGGRGAPDGGFWNEFPDRVADMLILLGVGLSIGNPALGWAATAMAFLTAYIRELGTSLAGEADFRGPMAKPHRMALITFAAVLSLGENLGFETGRILWLALWLVVIGAGITVLRRAIRLIRRLHQADAG